MRELRQRIDDARLAAGLRRGHSKSQAAFVDRFAPRVLGLSRRNTRTESDAEDLAQEILLASVSAIENWRGEASLNTFVFRIGLNLCARRHRRPCPEVSPLEALDHLAAADSDPATVSERRDTGAAVRRALASLSTDHREVVELHELDGLTYAECAALLGIPVGTVKSRLFHALRKLRPLLSEFSEATP